MSKKRATKSGTSLSEAWKQAKDNYRLTPRNLRRIASRKKIQGKR